LSNIKDVEKWLEDEFGMRFWPDPIKALAMVGDDIIKSWGIVKRGSKGIQAKFLQATLICMGYPCKLDGIFGSDSVDALKKYQKDNGFIVSGIAGKAIIRRIFM
jgi:hypothetical protein